MVGKVNPQRPHVLSVRAAFWTIGSFSLRGSPETSGDFKRQSAYAQKLNARKTRRSSICLRRIVGVMVMRVKLEARLPGSRHHRPGQEAVGSRLALSCELRRVARGIQVGLTPVGADPRL